jgi:type I restriction enzyme, S subunit
MSMTEWNPAELGSCVHTQKGYAFKSGWYCREGRRIVKVSNFTDDSVDWSDLICIPETIATDYLKYALSAGDVVLQTVGSWPNNPASVVGKCVSIPSNAAGSLLNQNAVKLSPTADFDRTFLFYLLRGEDFKTYIIGTAQGAASQAAITLDAIRSYRFSRPPLPTQQRIASILSAYDELIENSQRRIKILEAMARGLYREWFVHFRFPGHENHPRVASALGEIPQGWEVKSLNDVCRLTMGQSPKSEFYNEVGEGVPFHQGVTDFGDRFPSDRLFCTAAGRISEAGDILFSVRAPVGRMNIANKRIILGRGLSAIRYNEGSQAFLWEQLRNRFTKDDMMGNGAIFASVTKDDMQGIELVCPTRSVVEAATKHFEPLHSEIATLSQQIQNLRRTRDLLLPRLLSGQVNVEAP